jgi:hypothetical protein
MVQDKIYEYFERNPWLKVLFIFNDEFIALDLESAEWREGYRYVDFKGDWFTTKYRLDNEWANDRVVIFFHQQSPLQVKSLQANFPLMDVLTANMEYHHQDHMAFIQQHNIPDIMIRFVEQNIRILQSEPMLRMLDSYYADRSINEDIATRGILSYCLKASRVLEWDNLLLRILFLGRASESKNSLNFYINLHKSPTVAAKLNNKFNKIFGVGFDDLTVEKVGEIVRVMKYNAITQGLAPSEADNYRRYKINDSFALQHLNRIIELAISQKKTAGMLMELFNDLGSDIKEEDIIRWYGADANYYFISDALCEPILRTLLEQKVETVPNDVIKRIEELVLKHSDNGALAAVMDYTLLVARFYEKVSSISSFILNTPNDYISRYCEEYYQIDQLYRQSLDVYCNSIDKSIPLFETVQTVKLSLDLNYSKFVNRLNMEWNKCLVEAGGMGAVKLLRQENFYDSIVRPVEKKLVVIISDALRYEVAQELLQEIAKSKHNARLEPALAMLPTETKYCKPALFPHKSLSLVLDKEPNMKVDDNILSDTAKRSVHLTPYKSDAICVDYYTDGVNKYIQDINREIFKHPLVYVMHDVIDNTGHDGVAKDIVEACRKTINDIKELVRKILESYGVTEVIVTADHGFLFNDIEFAEKDKHKITEDYLERKSRYYLTHSSADYSGMVKFKLSEVSGMNNVDDVYVASPIGTNRLQAEGGGYMFTHGGSSLQELIIPVIICHKETSDKKRPVGVCIKDKNELSIQSSCIRFQLVQSEAVSMETKARTITCAIYHNDKPVTPVKKIYLNKTDASLDNRIYQMNLTFNTQVDAKVLELRIYDVEDNINPLIKENVTNNTLISNDFDFE